MHGRLVVAARLEPREVAHVDDRGVVVGRPSLRRALGVTVASATRRSFAAQVPPKRAPGPCRDRRGPSSPKVRVIQIEPSFFGNPWIQPRARAKSRSTQMYGQS